MLKEWDLFWEDGKISLLWPGMLYSEMVQEIQENTQENLWF